ncbi:MAG: hypothetical protein IJK04_02475 [Kiritimatiellae bacterium]|nr:hypothetical protein [Kiritimatiellia bacterium]
MPSTFRIRFASSSGASGGVHVTTGFPSASNSIRASNRAAAFVGLIPAT